MLNFYVVISLYFLIVWNNYLRIWSIQPFFICLSTSQGFTEGNKWFTPIRVISGINNCDWLGKYEFIGIEIQIFYRSDNPGNWMGQWGMYIYVSM